jgi:protein-S-isoprenylcysteine O-methyltransferase Ste14
MFRLLFLVIALLWLAWLVYWLAASIRVKAVTQREGWRSRLAYSIPLWVSALLLFDRHLGRLAETHLYPLRLSIVIAGTVLTAAGVAYAIWARVVLGGNWSASVTVKEDHELIRRGPYALSRHPIYTGLLLALFGTALAVGEARALVAILLAIGGLCYKLRLEEKAMRQTFGAAYDDYSREVKALIPFIV